MKLQHFTIVGVLPGQLDRRELPTPYVVPAPTTLKGGTQTFVSWLVKPTQTSTRLLTTSKLSKQLQKLAYCTLQPEDYQSGGEEVPKA